MRKLKYIMMIAAAAATVSCTKSFYDRNTNHENATDEMLTWDGLTTGSAFAQMTRNLFPSYQFIGDEEYGSVFYQIIQELTGNLFSGYAGNVLDGFNNTHTTYNMTAKDWHEYMFNEAYTKVIGSWEELDALREEFPNEAALGDILKVATMSRVTDSYGPIPYLQIGSGLVQMEYDSQEVVYRRFFEELEAAINVLTDFYNAQPATKILESYDNVFKGDLSKWIKFANTLRLRLGMRVVYADETLAMAQAEAAINHPVGLLAEASDVAALHKPVSGAWEYPLYQIQHVFGDSSIGATIETYMNGYNDPRRSKYFTVGSDGGYHGVRIGIDVDKSYNESPLLSKINATINDDILWMTPAESWFLKAEYWLRKGDKGQAKECYETGVKTSFSVSGVSGADTYLQDNTSTPGSFTDVVNSGNSYSNKLSDVKIAWDEAAGFEYNFEQIITQKYIALYPEGQEAWTEFRRTGYPKVIPVAKNSSGSLIDTDQQIRRLPYPLTEYRTNSANVKTATGTLNSESFQAKGDNGGTRLWWDKNTRF